MSAIAQPVPSVTQQVVPQSVTIAQLTGSVYILAPSAPITVTVMGSNPM